MEDRGEVVDVVLPNGAAMRVVVVDSGGAQDVGLLDSLDLEGVRETIEGLAELVTSAVQKAKPTKATVEFGLSITAKSGKLTGLLVDGSAGGSLKVTLSWGG
ncbi:MAG: CU044_2847 family protein [Egibacteraceae bacterium]